MKTTPVKKVLVLFAHPAQSHSLINLPLFELAKKHPAVTAIDLYSEYPDSYILVSREQERLVEHDVVVMLFPFYWYSTPAILKDWQDLVLQHGFAFGSEGVALKGKPLICCVSTGAPAEAYTREGANGYTVRELLRPLEATAKLCGMPYLPPFIFHGALTADRETKLPPHLQSFSKLLDLLTGGEISFQDMQGSESINEFL